MMELKEGMRWDYKNVFYSFALYDELDDWMNESAKEGWELYSLAVAGDRQAHCVFRRQIINERTIELNRRRAEMYRIEREEVR